MKTALCRSLLANKGNSMPCQARYLHKNRKIFWEFCRCHIPTICDTMFRAIWPATIEHQFATFKHALMEIDAACLLYQLERHPEYTNNRLFLVWIVDVPTSTVCNVCVMRTPKVRHNYFNVQQIYLTFCWQTCTRLTFSSLVSLVANIKWQIFVDHHSPRWAER